ncbi:hypothetical protein OM076_17940 [Solirubrobacter ginsenosidimutans]|uniref:Uncharacterized protein n=1 Tax=Solirubrobacter ginsenosidimutans TaxID=490573 RepID=A0A9X3MZ59_9ACTN|nr:hypothetical protein [Solirubrobacter ginsenosidimutans]MDA0162158.1 hypothetical protein [Solirubrobacter ginsenosidimutans]
MSGRTPEEVLAVFGRDLRRYRPPRRRRWRRVFALVALVLAAGGATAAATGSIWAPSPRVSARAFPAGAPVPDAASRPVYVASGPGWRLSASTCRFGRRATAAVFLAVAHGGAGWRCNALSRAVASGVVPPPTLFAPPRSPGRFLLFGAAPGATTRIQALLRDARTGNTRLRGFPVRPAGDAAFTVYVARLAGDAELLTVIGLDARGRPTMRCDQETCR